MSSDTDSWIRLHGRTEEGQAFQRYLTDCISAAKVTQMNGLKTDLLKKYTEMGSEEILLFNFQFIYLTTNFLTEYHVLAGLKFIICN